MSTEVPNVGGSNRDVELLYHIASAGCRRKRGSPNCREKRLLRRIHLVEKKDAQHRYIETKGWVHVTKSSNHLRHLSKVKLRSESYTKHRRTAFHLYIPHNPHNPQDCRPQRSSHGPNVRLPQCDPSPFLSALFAQNPEVPLAVFHRSRRFWHWDTAFIGSGSRRGEVDGGVVVGGGLGGTHLGG